LMLKERSEIFHMCPCADAHQISLSWEKTLCLTNFLAKKMLASWRYVCTRRTWWSLCPGGSRTKSGRRKTPPIPSQMSCSHNGLFSGSKSSQ
jgi:hypothetical protein